MSQVVPTGPGWRWVEADGYKEVTEVWEDVDYDAPRCSPRRGFECSVDDERLVDGVDGCDASDGESVPAIIWLAPVAKHEEVEQLRAEVARMSEWLYRIGGADSPTDDAEQLRRWAYDALTLGREVPS